MKSATKSVNSILIGIAIDIYHLIYGVDEKISDFFPEYSDVFTNKEKRSDSPERFALNDHWFFVGRVVVSLHRPTKRCCNDGKQADFSDTF